MSFRSDAHLMLGGEQTPPEVDAWQHPQIPDSYTVTIDTADRSGHIAISGTPSQLIELLGHMTDAVIQVATAPGQATITKAPAEPASRGS